MGGTLVLSVVECRYLPGADHTSARHRESHGEFHGMINQKL